MLLFLILVPPMAWHCKCKNIPAISLIFWLMYNNLVTIINAAVWSGAGFYQISGKGYCDVVGKLNAGSSSGMVASICAMAMNLYFVLGAKETTLIDPQSRIRLAVNVAMCWATPVVIMATNYLIQASRFIVVRYYGCNIAYDPSALTYVLYSMWPVVWLVGAMVFAGLTIFEYLRKRHDVKDILKCTNSGLDIRRFARLLIFLLLSMLVLFPVCMIYFLADVKNSRLKYSFERVHDEYWQTITHWDFGRSFSYRPWVNNALSVITFLLFGVGTDALAIYRSAMVRIKVLKPHDHFEGAASHKVNTYESDETRVHSEIKSLRVDEFADFDVMTQIDTPLDTEYFQNYLVVRH